MLDDDLEAGQIDAVMKLAPVLAWLTRDRPALKIVRADRLFAGFSR